MKTKINYTMLIFTSFICLSPIIMSLIVYNDLPDRVAVHWDLEGNVNRYASKAVAAFGLPLFLTAINIFVFVALCYDPKHGKHPKAMQKIVEWIIPFVSILAVPITLFMAIGVKVPVVPIVFTFVGILFILLGNYLPKTRQNYIVGIRLPWTLNDSENWNKTNRLAGYLIMICGSLFIVSAFLPVGNALIPLIIGTIVLMAVVPVLYSFFLYKNKKKSV